MIDDDWTHNEVLHKDCFISSAASHDNDMALHLSTFDPNELELYDDDSLTSIKMEPSDETSDYHGSSSGSPSSSLSSPNNMRDEPLGLDINFCANFSNTNFSPAPGSSHSPGFGSMMSAGHASQQHSPLPPVAHFSHSHLHQQPDMANGNPPQANHNHNHPHATPSYGGTNYILHPEAMFYEGTGGMGLAAAQQQLKSRSKMHEMAVKQRLITDQSLQDPTQNGSVHLSAEERRTLLQEGYPIPNRLPLSKSEEESLKIVRRKIKNKLSAQESRRKRKEYLDALEIRVQGCVQENTFLKNRIRQLEASNRQMMVKLQQYEQGDVGHNANGLVGHDQNSN